MYPTRNCKRKFAMRDKSNLPTIDVESCKVLQKIPLTEVNKTLRPRRGCKENTAVNYCKENQVPQSKSNSKPLLQKCKENQVPQSKSSSKPLVQKSSETLIPSLTDQESEKNSGSKNILQCVQNLNIKKSDLPVNPTKQNKIIQRIPLVEHTETLRPRRGFRNKGAVDNSKENQLCQSDSNSKPRSNTRNKKLLEPSRLKSNKPIEVIGCSEINEKTKGEDTNKGTLHSFPNTNLENKKSGLIYNTNASRKRTLISTNCNAKNNPSKKIKSSRSKTTREISILSRFPKWISNGIESLKRGNKRVRISVYDLEKDEQIMLEKSMTKKVVKKAKITKTKRYATKHNMKSQFNKNRGMKKVSKKLIDNCSKKCFVKKNEEELANDNWLDNIPSEKNGDEDFATLDKDLNLKQCEVILEKLEVATCKMLPQSKETKQSSFDKKQDKSYITDLINVFSTTEVSSEVHETPEKHGNQSNLTHSGRFNCASTNLLSFPMPQLSSTPENIDRPRIAAKLCGNLETSMLEIPRIVPHQTLAEFKDSEFLSPDKAISVEIQLFESPVTDVKKDSKKVKVVNKLSAVKNLNAVLKTHKSNQLLPKDHIAPQEKNIPNADSNGNIFNVEEAPTPNSNTEALSSNKAAKKTIKSNPISSHSNKEPAEKIIPRPKRTCQQNKPVVTDSSDLELSSEGESDEHEMTLFESPQKKKAVEPENSSPSKMALMELFPDEFGHSPVKVVDVEEKVLKPRLSYHSPALVKRYVSKVKKASKVTERVKTKQDKLIDSLNQHFDELDDLELCIE